MAARHSWDSQHDWLLVGSISSRHAWQQRLMGIARSLHDQCAIVKSLALEEARRWRNILNRASGLLREVIGRVRLMDLRAGRWPFSSSHAHSGSRRLVPCPPANERRENCNFGRRPVRVPDPASACIFRLLHDHAADRRRAHDQSDTECANRSG
jgi:hypothetical protein